MDEAFPISVAFWCQLDVNCSPRFGFPLRHKPFQNHGLDSSVHNSSIETEKCGDLILIERGAAAERGQDEAASRRAARFSLKLLPDGKIGRSDMGKYRILQDVLRNIFFYNGDHRTVTVASRGLRH